MPYFNATDGSDNSKLTDIRKTLNNKSLVKDGNDLVVIKNDIEVRLIGDFKVNSHGKIKSGELHSVEVSHYSAGTDLYTLTDMKVQITNFLDAVYDNTWSNYVPKLFKHDDHILGSFHDDKLYGFKSKDKLNGYGGDDELHGGKGKDALRGYTGDDAFVFDSKLSAKYNVDTIKDWNYLKGQGGGTNSIWLDAHIFTAFKGMEGDGISSKNFIVGKKAKTEDQHLVYRYDSHKNVQKLYYDPDGAGGHQKILFAKIQGHHDLAYGDFLIV